MLLTRSGFSILGGLMFGIIAGVIYTVRAGLPPRTMSDAVAPAMMLGYAIGRLGCQISGDGDWGIAADPALKPAWLPTWLWAQTYDGNIAGVLIPSPGVYPTPVYESAMALGGFFVLWALRKHPYRKGWLFAMYLVLTGSERMLIERIRVNPIFRIAGIHASQAEFISAAFVLVGIAALIVLGRSQSAVDVASKATPR
jgi:phosphatidylglycerol:prolipoprotein diacylglycerol transferase